MMPYFPLIRGMFLLRRGLRFSVWALEIGFLMRKSEKRGPNFLSPMLPILRLTFLESSCNFRAAAGKTRAELLIKRELRHNGLN